MRNSAGEALSVKTSNLLWEWFEQHVAEEDHKYINSFKKLDLKNTNTTNKAIEKLAEHEELLMDLYFEFSKYQENHDMWLDLAAEEMSHAYLIRSWYSLVLESKIKLTERFKLSAVGLSMKFLRLRLEEAKKKEIPLLRALGISLDIEQSLIEKRFFESYTGDAKEFKNQLEKMEKSIKVHIEKVISEIKKIKERQL